ncbi:hypothetical protein HII17_09795 [Thalassotalea sp. M1531]|uniref:Uncharacterized protein n=1 Tax=Thalassotalea algicola TaxID=2716224 RepID=A0A7Y0LD02_9GAMM|nr:hypothetical protein [Thalassotalea algicola]NMP31857.1 hypothetical protein [Thalassotalea algicola]
MKISTIFQFIILALIIISLAFLINSNQQLQRHNDELSKELSKLSNQLIQVNLSTKNIEDRVSKIETDLSLKVRELVVAN